METGIVGFRVRWIWHAVNVRTCPSGLSGSANDIHLSFCMEESKVSSAIAAIVADQVDPTRAITIDIAIDTGRFLVLSSFEGY